jgi:hypothetical protein
MSFSGALAYKTSDDTSVDYSTPTGIPFDTTAYDYGDWWTSGAPTKMVVPSGVTQCRIHAGALLQNVTTGVLCTFTIVKNGSSYRVSQETSQTNGDRQVCFVTPIFEVTAGDEFEIFLGVADVSIDIDADYTFFGIEATDVSSRVLAGAATQSGIDFAAGAFHAISYNATDEYDTAAYHDPSSNDTRITIPSGVTMGRFVGTVYVDAIAPSNYVQVLHMKSGANFNGAGNHSIEVSDTNVHVCLYSAPVEVVAGEIYEQLLQTESDTSVDIVAGANYFGFEAIDAATFKGALVRKSADQTLANYTAGANVTWNTDVYDIGGWHDTGSNTELFTVPAGVFRVRLYACVTANLIASGNMTLLTLLKNPGSGVYPGIAAQRTEISAATFVRNNLVSPILEVTAGDTFALNYLVETDNSVSIVSDISWFAIEAIDDFQDGAGAAIGDSTVTGAGSSLVPASAAPPVFSDGGVAWRVHGEEERRRQDERDCRLARLRGSQEYKRLKAKLKMVKELLLDDPRSERIQNRIAELEHELWMMEQ